jgi:hypothetical protein
LRLSMRAFEAPTGSDKTIFVPAVALECKRHLERNTLAECAGLAARVKRATPYCLCVVAGTLQDIPSLCLP